MEHGAVTDEVEVRCGLGAATLLLLAAVGPAGFDGVALLLVATTVLAHFLDATRALLLGLTGWALATGFAVNTAGELTLAPWDAVRLGVFVLVAAGVAARRERR
ncbi:hypothetical protein ASG76_12970 [Nocardioides sp. Soil774]|uniref:hypothetical protein n=1 Tax=Nocardioides sp. Soil774 TaxID=1736408 RepID=UPI0006F32DC8|nr:hypothetical protein [Nocardioides sp. Soil774]KRE94282.1 hypothetical protein ASG76_12970 [Nocardioides sp. Soil774]